MYSKAETKEAIERCLPFCRIQPAGSVISVICVLPQRPKLLLFHFTSALGHRAGSSRACNFFFVIVALSTRHFWYKLEASAEGRGASFASDTCRRHGRKLVSGILPLSFSKSP